MKRFCMRPLWLFVVLCGGITQVSGVAASVDYQAGADRLVELQNTDGGWDWPLDDGNPDSTSPTNTLAPIAMGLAQAYLLTKDTSHLPALTAAGSLLLSKTNDFSPTDGYLAYQLDKVFGGNTYTKHVTEKFYDPLADGTYDLNGAGTLYDTAGYVGLIRTEYTGVDANLAAWDIGMGLYAAGLVGADTSAWLAGTTSEINELDGNNDYDVLGLAGAILGLASVGADYDPTAGTHQAASNLSDLAYTLAGYQLGSGGFTWNSNYLDEGLDETVQETAYSMLALNAVDSQTYRTNLLDARAYLASIQLDTGGWENYTGSGENNEVTGEALWAASVVPEPHVLLLVGTGLFGLFWTRGRKHSQNACV